MPYQFYRSRNFEGKIMHKLLTNHPGKRMFLLGNEAIARGGLEAGVAVATTYPGTPSSEISMNYFQVSGQTDLYFEYSTNEKVALEVAAAAANAGVKSMCIMKHVGLNVAADALMTLAYIGVKGALVIVTADDPYMFSSQNEQDNRYYGKFSGLSILEPSSVQEAKDMTIYAFELSEMLQQPVILRTTTRLNHATGIVELGAVQSSEPMGDFTKSPLDYVAVPAVSRRLHARLLERIEKAKKISDQCSFNFMEGSGSRGIVCNGVSYNYVSDAVSDLGLEDRVRVLRIGLSHPLPERLIKDFLKGCEKVLVVEEGEPIMEESIKAFAQEEKRVLPIAGKAENLFSRLYEYDPAGVRKCVADFFEVPRSEKSSLDVSDVPELPQRPPNLCAGCSHRATFYAVKKAAEGMDTICPNDIGCYTLGFLPPLSMGDFLICMGSSVGTACGFSKVTGKKVIGFIGDSTFFHSGIPGLINAVFNNHNFTLVILDNGTTAMTGHQPNPGVDMKNLDKSGYGRVSIEEVVRAVGVTHVDVIYPFNVKKSIETVKEALSVQGVSVIISREICTLYARSIKKPRRNAFYVSDRCNQDRVCINELGCPAFSVVDNRVTIDPIMCSGCSVCAQICPEHAIVPLKK